MEKGLLAKDRWLRIKWIRYNKDDREHIQFKYTFADEDFKTIKINHAVGHRRKTTKPKVELTPLYRNKLSISDNKLKDLLSVCQQGIIPDEYHPYYNKLTSSTNKRDRLPLPDIQESESDDDE